MYEAAHSATGSAPGIGGVLSFERRASREISNCLEQILLSVASWLARITSRFGFTRSCLSLHPEEVSCA